MQRPLAHKYVIPELELFNVKISTAFVLIVFKVFVT